MTSLVLKPTYNDLKAGIFYEIVGCFLAKRSWEEGQVFDNTSDIFTELFNLLSGDKPSSVTDEALAFSFLLQFFYAEEEIFEKWLDIEDLGRVGTWSKKIVHNLVKSHRMGVPINGSLRRELTFF